MVLGPKEKLREFGDVGAEVGRGAVETYQYGTDLARELCTEDYVQCPGTSVEVRVNIWNNMQGDSPAPDLTHLIDFDGDSLRTRVQVILDLFEYTPSKFMDGAPNGSNCSKDCQCLPSSVCSPEGVCITEE